MLPPWCLPPCVQFLQPSLLFIGLSSFPGAEQCGSSPWEPCAHELGSSHTAHWEEDKPGRQWEQNGCGLGPRGMQQVHSHGDLHSG